MAGILQQAQGPAGQPAPAEQPVPAEQPAAPATAAQDPAYDAALQWIGERFYNKQAAKSAAAALKGSQDPVATLAEIAYATAQAADEHTGAEMADENLGKIGLQALMEVVEVAQAAGVQLQPADVASALKQMLVRFLQDQGLDPTQLQEAMNAISPQEFNALTEQVGGQPAGGAPPAEEPEGGM